MALGDAFLECKTENGMNLVEIGYRSGSDLHGDCCCKFLLVDRVRRKESLRVHAVS